MSYLEKKTLNDYNKDVKQVFNTLTISGNYRVIGSGSFKKIKYASDYDLEEVVKEAKGKTILDKIYHMFKKKFEDCKKDSNYFITDFKCGLNTDGEPLRWTYKDIKKGYQILEDGRKMKFQDCILIKATMKMDMIVLIDGIFTEFSDNYYINIGDKSNYFEHEQEPEHIETGILKSLDEYLNVHQNYWKTLKRLFSLSTREPKKYKKDIKKMMDFFNGKTGLINKCKNELEILMLVIENKFRKPKIDDIHYNLSVIDKWADEAGLNISTSIKKMMNKKSFPSLYKSIDKLVLKLFQIINKSSYLFLKKKSNLNLII